MRHLHQLIAVGLLLGSTLAHAARLAELSPREFNGDANDCHQRYLSAIGPEEYRRQILLNCMREIFKKRNAVSANYVDALRGALIGDYRKLGDSTADRARADTLRAGLAVLNEGGPVVSASGPSAAAAN